MQFVAQRLPEFGLRLALGSSKSGLVAFIMLRWFRVVILGIAFGTALSFVEYKLLTSLTFGLKEFAFADLFIGASVVAGVCGLATMIPALRSGDADPAELLRSA